MTAQKRIALYTQTLNREDAARGGTVKRRPLTCWVCLPYRFIKSGKEAEKKLRVRFFSSSRFAPPIFNASATFIAHPCIQLFGF